MTTSAPNRAAPSRALAIAQAALAPCLWGTTYITFTQTLPTEHPLLVAALRALPAGLLLIAIGAGWPPRDKLLRLTALGLLNIGIFFALLFVAAGRLPGGVAAVLSSCQPLIVTLLAWPFLGRQPRIVQIAAALAGLGGVALLVLGPNAGLDLIGAVAAVASAVSMALGTILIERWGRVGTPLQIAAWQLALGGLALLPIALIFEGWPGLPSLTNVAGMAYLVLFGTAFAYWIWVRAIGQIGADAAFLGLLSPTVATIVGAVVLGEWLRPAQWLGVAIILGATIAGMALARRRPARGA